MLLYYFCSWVLSGMRLVFAKHSGQQAMKYLQRRSVLEINWGRGEAALWAEADLDRSGKPGISACLKKKRKKVRHLVLCIIHKGLGQSLLWYLDIKVIQMVRDSGLAIASSKAKLKVDF